MATESDDLHTIELSIAIDEYIDTIRSERASRPAEARLVDEIDRLRAALDAVPVEVVSSVSKVDEILAWLDAGGSVRDVDVDEVENALRSLAVEVLRLRCDLDDERDAIPALLAETRKDERAKLAALFEREADVLRSFSPDGLSIEMLAFLLRLDHG